MRSTRTKVALVGLAVAATSLSGCQSDQTGSTPPAAPPIVKTTAPAAPADNGVAALTADKILQRAKAALVKTKSFRAKGTMDEDGKQIAADLKVDGADFAATMAFDKAQVKLLAVGGQKYLQPNAQFWISTDPKQGAFLAKTIGNRWVAGAGSDKSFADLFTIGDVDELLKPTGALSKGTQKQIHGVPAIGLKDAGDPGSVLYIATTGEPYPLQMTGKGSTMEFSAFGEKFAGIAKPSADQIIDLGKLNGK